MTDDQGHSFTVRLGPDHYKVFAGLAKIKGQKVSVLARDYIQKGIAADTDEEVINHTVEEYKTQLLAAVRKLRAPMDNEE